MVQSGADTDNTWTPEQIAEMRASVDGVPQTKLVQALRAFGQADLREDPLSPLPLELALADAVLEPGTRRSRARRAAHATGGAAAPRAATAAGAAMPAPGSGAGSTTATAERIACRRISARDLEQRLGRRDREDARQQRAGHPARLAAAGASGSIQQRRGTPAAESAATNGCLNQRTQLISRPSAIGSTLR